MENTNYFVLPEECIAAIHSTNQRIDTQLQTWKTYITELEGGAKNMTVLANIMQMTREPINRHIALSKSIRLTVQK